jgi:HPt (histidine-containing phosphotransfer) domain-containing protein
MVDHLITQLVAGDGAAAARAAHALRGSCRTMGAEALGAKAGQVERMQSEPPATRRAVIAELQGELARVRETLEGYLRSRAA